MSYQNSNLLSLHPTPVVTKAIAAPIVTKVASPISVLGVDGKFINAFFVCVSNFELSRSSGIGRFGVGRHQSWLRQINHYLP